MQSITTGYSMETFFDTIVIILLLSSIVLNYVIICRVEMFKNISPISMNEIEECIHRSMLPKEPLEAATPIKKNNWDSVKKAFKGPARIEIDE